MLVCKMYQYFRDSLNQIIHLWNNTIHQGDIKSDIIVYDCINDLFIGHLDMRFIAHSVCIIYKLDHLFDSI